MTSAPKASSNFVQIGLRRLRPPGPDADGRPPPGPLPAPPRPDPPLPPDAARSAAEPRCWGGRFAPPPSSGRRHRRRHGPEQESRRCRRHSARRRTCEARHHRRHLRRARHHRRHPRRARHHRRHRHRPGTIDGTVAGRGAGGAAVAERGTMATIVNRRPTVGMTGSARRAIGAGAAGRRTPWHATAWRGGADAAVCRVVRTVGHVPQPHNRTVWRPTSGRAQTKPTPLAFVCQRNRRFKHGTASTLRMDNLSMLLIVCRPSRARPTVSAVVGQDASGRRERTASEPPT